MDWTGRQAAWELGRDRAGNLRQTAWGLNRDWAFIHSLTLSTIFDSSPNTGDLYLSAVLYLESVLFVFF